jgi:methionyl-tRNA formyltransferase
MKIIYCGFGRAGLECFYQLLSSYNIEVENLLVFTHDSEENSEFIKHLENNNIKYYKDSVNNYINEVNSFKPDYLISVYYRFIIKKEILEIVNHKAMNLHPSLLPAYRGTKSSVWALLNNEKQTGVSFHYINEKIDDGNIILQKSIDINSNDTAYSLYHKLISVFVRNFNEAFDLVINNYIGKKQVGEISYYKRELPYNGIRKFSEITYKEAEQFVKAMFYPPFKGAMFEKDDGTIIEILSIKDLFDYKYLIGR